MEEKEKILVNSENVEQPSQKPECDDWYTQALEELEDFIESQGIYLRQ